MRISVHINTHAQNKKGKRGREGKGEKGKRISLLCCAALVGVLEKEKKNGFVDGNSRGNIQMGKGVLSLSLSLSNHNSIP